METVLFRFDSVERFPVLETFTTARSPVQQSVTDQTGDAQLHIRWTRTPLDPPDVEIVLACPVSAVDGEPKRFLLDVVAEVGGPLLALEVGDAAGGMLVYQLGTLDRKGAFTLEANAATPSTASPSEAVASDAHVKLPLQVERIVIMAQRECGLVDIRLKTLRVSGPIRLAAAGLADRGR